MGPKEPGVQTSPQPEVVLPADGACETWTGFSSDAFTIKRITPHLSSLCNLI